jgi:hypothetical protein
LSARGANSANRPRIWSDKAPHDIDIETLDTGELRVAVKGSDVYDPNTGDIRSNDVRDIAAWFIDTRGLSGGFRRSPAIHWHQGKGPLATFLWRSSRSPRRAAMGLGRLSPPC